MPITQKVIALTFAFSPLLGGVGALIAAEVLFAVTVIAVMHVYDTIKLINKEKISNQLKYVSAYQEAEKSLYNHKDLAAALGIKFESKENKESSVPKKGIGRYFAMAILSTLDMIKPLVRSIASLNPVFISITVAEILFDGYARFKKIFENEKSKREVLETLEAAKIKMPSFKSEYELALKTQNRYIEAEALKRLIKEHPNLVSEQNFEKCKLLLEEYKANVVIEIAKDKNSIYSQDNLESIKITGPKLFFRAFVDAIKIEKSAISEYDTLKNSEMYKSLNNNLDEQKKQKNNPDINLVKRENNPFDKAQEKSTNQTTKVDAEVKLPTNERDNPFYVMQN